MSIPFRYWLTRVGERMSRSQVRAVSATAKYLEFGRAMSQFGYRMKPRFDTRERLFDLIGREVGERNVLYLEFGVFHGSSMRYWSNMLKNPESKLHGFDSFEGLPESWNEGADKGHFSTDGAIPTIDDCRVKFFKGWFDQTLATYQLPEHEALVVMIDADLYSSTKLVLDHMSPYMVPGTYLYFDDFADTHGEFRAFMEFSASSSRKFVVRGATNSMMMVLFQCVA